MERHTKICAELSKSHDSIAQSDAQLRVMYEQCETAITAQHSNEASHSLGVTRSACDMDVKDKEDAAALIELSELIAQAMQITEYDEPTATLRCKEIALQMQNGIAEA